MSLRTGRRSSIGGARNPFLDKNPATGIIFCLGSSLPSTVTAGWGTRSRRASNCATNASFSSGKISIGMYVLLHLGETSRFAYLVLKHDSAWKPLYPDSCRFLGVLMAFRWANLFASRRYKSRSFCALQGSCREPHKRSRAPQNPAQTIRPAGSGCEPRAAHYPG